MLVGTDDGGIQHQVFGIPLATCTPHGPCRRAPKQGAPLFCQTPRVLTTFSDMVGLAVLLLGIFATVTVSGASRSQLF